MNGLSSALISSSPIFLLVQSVQCGWVDPDTQNQFHTTTPLTKSDDRDYKLVSLQPSFLVFFASKYIRFFFLILNSLYFVFGPLYSFIYSFIL